MYDPTIGQFIERDPIASTTNLYCYCGNDPTGSTDPTGEASPPGIQVGAPTYLGLGIAQPWYAEIKLPKSDQFGMVIQEVNVDYQYALTGANGKTIYIDSAKAPIFQTNDPSQRFSDRYWEMWAVINGDFFAGGISGPFVTKVNGSTVNLPGIQTLQTDTFSTPTNLSIGGTTLVKTCGWFSQTGALMWVSKTKQQMQDPATYAGWEINSKSPAGPLYFSSTQPVAWKANVVNPNAVFATRSWFFQWCWDKNNPKGNYDAQIPLPKAAQPWPAPRPKDSNGAWSDNGSILAGP